MIFPQEFFNEEIRDGFTVPEMMKRAWAAELEVLDVIRNLCIDNGLIYFAYCGSLLGAIRHHGFIPWDDDIDIAMLRSDYDRFMQIADEELPEGFVISGIYGSEPRLWKANGEPQGRVIADETVFTLPRYMNYFHAFPYMRIGVDIFPLDNVPSDPDRQYDLIQGVNELQTAGRYLDVYRKDGTLNSRIKPYKYLLDDITYDINNDEEYAHAIWLASDRLAASCCGEGDSVSDILYLRTPSDRRGFNGFNSMKAEWFSEGTEKEFECTTINVPVQYDDVLKWEFGDDYMTPVRFAADHTYPFYATQEKAFVELLHESGVDTPVDEFCRNWHKLNGLS
ncbi:MAG: LicD family protein [Lachnospiraceae bacterium]|nr:LicD family protein [Lachnospiraceae bacterium]